MEAKLFIFAAVAISEVFSACTPSGVAAVKCPGLNEFYYRWKIEEMYEGKTRVTQRSTTSTIYVDGYTYNSSICFIADYYVSVEISHYPDMTFPDKVTKKFYFSADPMEIELVGGEQRYVTYGDDLVVDAKKLSLDLSYPPEEDAFEGNFVTWRIRPLIRAYRPPHELVITVPGNLLGLNKTYSFLVQIFRSKIPRNRHSATAFQVVTVTSFASPEINLICLRNCINPNSHEVTLFAVECTHNCKNLTYTWHVNPQPAKNKVQFGNGTDKILFDAFAFNIGDAVVVTIYFGNIPYIKSIQYVSGLLRGQCTIHPLEGISSLTKFQINCEGFYSPFGLSLCMIYQILGEENGKIQAILLSEFSFREESDLYLPAGDPVHLSILVEDHAFLQEKVTLEVPVKEYSNEKEERLLGMVPLVKIQILSSANSSITSYSQEGFHNEVVQLTNSVLDTMANLNMPNDTRMDLHKHMVEAILRSTPVRLSSALQRLFILKKIMKLKLKTDTETTRLVGEALLQCTLNAHVMFNHKRTTPLPRFFTVLIFQLTIEVASYLLEPNYELYDILNDEIPPHLYDSYDEFHSQKIQIRDDYRIMTTNVIIALQTNCLTNLHTAVPDELYIYYDTDMISLKTRRILLSRLRGRSYTVRLFTYPKNKAFLPPALIASLQNNYSFIDYQIAVFDGNPFWWHMNSTWLSTTVVLFDLFVKCDKIRKVHTPFYIFLEIIEFPYQMIQGTITGENVLAYTVELEPHETLITEFEAVGEYPNDYLVVWSECFCTDKDFQSDRRKHIKNGTSFKTRTIKVENESTNEVKLVYICIKKLTPTVTYHLESQIITCMYWDIPKESWLRDGCKLINSYITKNGTLVCECNHVSVFAGQIHPPNYIPVIDEGIEFTIDFAQNYLMIFVIAMLLFLWIISLILAHLKDKSMKKNNVVHKLDDNVPGDSNPYLVVVFTGVFYDAQTTADVAFKIVGEQSNSRIHLIKCHGVTLLKRNSQDWFIIYCPHYLGQIKKIQIWHNCKGSYPHWYCDRIIVQDMKIGAQYCFTVKKWFSVIWGSGKIFREVRVRKPGKKMRKIFFKTQFEKDIKEEHMWLSIVSRDIQSNFNSKERVSTGFCFLFLSMLASALLYRVPEGIPADSIDGQSSFDIGLSNILIFVESWIVATPLSVMILYIFQNSAPL